MNTALILSGGVGSRLGGDMPKQYIEVGGRILLSYCLERLSRHPLVDAVQIVAQEEWQGTIRSCLKRYDINKKIQGLFKSGGKPPALHLQWPSGHFNLCGGDG